MDHLTDNDLNTLAISGLTNETDQNKLFSYTLNHLLIPMCRNKKLYYPALSFDPDDVAMEIIIRIQTEYASYDPNILYANCAGWRAFMYRMIKCTVYKINKRAAKQQPHNTLVVPPSQSYDYIHRLNDIRNHYTEPKHTILNDYILGNQSVKSVATRLNLTVNQIYKHAYNIRCELKKMITDGKI